jgi:GDPmannose 4,6-dehydratase
MKALVIGCKGQDGTYLCDQLQAAGDEVFGISRDGLQGPDGALRHDVSIEDTDAVARTVSDLAPDRIYYLAAHHHASEEDTAGSGDLLQRSFATHTLALVNVLDAIVAHAPAARLFYAASSHVFGKAPTHPQDETTPLAPICAYGISKAAGVQLCRFYRRQHGLFAAVGILYNHESPRRGPRFLTRKIVRGAVAIERGETAPIVLANLDSEVDWGYAPEYTEAMARILDLDEADDFVIASGRRHSVADFVAAVFACLDLNWRDHVQVDPSLLRKTEDRGVLVGDSRRLQAATGWAPRTGVAELARIMVEAEREAG